MLTEMEARVQKVLPAIENRAARRVEALMKDVDIEKLVKPSLRGQSKQEREETKRELTKTYKAIFPPVLKSLAGIDEMQRSAKLGVANLLKAAGYKAGVDTIMRGYSGNEYYVSVSAATDKRLLIVDQTLLSSKMALDWLKISFPKSFEQYKVTVADFFKFLDIYQGLGGKPAVYWLHDYRIEPELDGKVGFSMKRILTEMAYRLGELEGKSREQVERDIDETVRAADTIVSSMFRGFSKPLQNIAVGGREPLPFDVRQTAKRFFVPYINTSILDMLEASVLDPNSVTDGRILKGMSVELGLLDFLNPPWTDYALSLAAKGKTTAEDIGKIISAADRVGHPGRYVASLGINPEKLTEDPNDAVEALEQNNLVITEEKDTIRISPRGREVVREIKKKPKEHAIRKALNYISSRVKIGIGPVTVEKKDG